MNPRLKNTTDETLKHWLRDQGEPAYRFNQIQEWLYRRWAQEFSEMTNLPQKLRERLARDWAAFSLKLESSRSAPDGTEKFLFSLHDGETVETVLIPSPRRTTVCISTQVGCPVGCVFCATGRSGFVRNLETAEIADQVLFACRRLGRRINNVVVMGMGEPLLNLAALIPALERLTDSGKLGIGDRHITISTVGLPGRIRTLADHGRQWKLALSLHAARDSLRKRLIPEAWRRPVDSLLEACRYYRRKTGRIVTFEYVLLAGINDDGSALDDLAAAARHARAKVNLIPYNAAGGRFQPPRPEIVRTAADRLKKHGVNCTIRISRGREIHGACGQLRRSAPTSSTP